MAFALTKAELSGVDIAGVSKKRGYQKAVLYITALASDVDLDIGDDSGTFWTAAAANSTYGTLASKVLERLQNIADNSAGLLSVSSEQLIDRVQVGTLTGAGQYTVGVQDSRPNITTDAADGETSWTVEITWLLNDGIFPVVAIYG